jgi:hypothetical protein
MGAVENVILLQVMDSDHFGPSERTNVCEFETTVLQ